MKLLVAAAILAALSSPAALAQSRAGGDSDEPAPAGAACPGCGVVSAIRATPLRGEPQWLGTISGGIPSGPPSSAVGAGRGLPSAGGAGALPGRDGELAARRRTVYEVVVTMDDKSTRKLHYEHRPALSVGDRVRVSGGQVYLR